MRIYRVASDSGQWPHFSDDDYLQFVVTEAVLVRGREAEREQQEKADKEAERKQWRESALSQEAAESAPPREG